MNDYVIKDSKEMHELTKICRIGIVKRVGNEWSTFVKKINVDTVPDFAAVRFDSQGVCGVFVNGKHIEGNTGRYPNRITYAECTSALVPGENEIKIVLGGHYYQVIRDKIRARAGALFSCVAAQRLLEKDGKTTEYVTDESWACISDDGQTTPTCYSEVTRAEYDRFWLSAALVPEYSPISCPKAITDVVGAQYQAYISGSKLDFAYPEKVVATNMSADGAAFVANDDAPFITYDFGRIYVGYVSVACEAQTEGTLQVLLDYSESTDDFDPESDSWLAKVARKLSVQQALKKGKNTILLIRRRAGRFMKLVFDCKVKLTSVCFKLSMTPAKQHGWFCCENEMLNEMWEVGKYTLHVNKHQEYESCPRNEMKYFSGDGIIDALIDYYAFGDPSLTYSSLSLAEPTVSGGLPPAKLARNIPLTDYPAWRIISAYNHYLYFGDKYFVEQYFDELAACMDWLTERMNSAYMIYQYPVFYDPFFTASEAVEFTCSFDRLGEKPLVNAVLYKSLLCMAEFADLVGDQRGKEWRLLAEKVYEAFNERLWDDSVNAYVDTYDRSYVPQDGNALALLFGLAKGERAKLVMASLRKHLWTPYGSALLSQPIEHTRGGSKTLSPAMNMHEAEARFLAGDADGAMELIKNCWGTMLKKGAKTFWEFAPTNADGRWPVPAHAWSGGCTYLLSAYVLGIRPQKAGYETAVFAPYTGMKSFKGVVPTCRGLIAVSCTTENGKRAYTLAIPKGMEMDIQIPKEDTVTIRQY